jgi:hypothetical protein
MNKCVLSNVSTFDPAEVPRGRLQASKKQVFEKQLLKPTHFACDTKHYATFPAPNGIKEQ